MVMQPLSAEELLVERKEVLFTSEIDESKGKQIQIIAHCNSEIESFQAKITSLEQRRANAQDLLDELEKRYPAEVILKG